MKGIILSYDNSPNTREGYGLVFEGIPKKYMFVKSGKVIGIVQDIIRQNVVYGMVESLAKVDVEELKRELDAESWHQTVVKIKWLGMFYDGELDRNVIPPFAGDKFESISGREVEKILMVDEGIFLGNSRGFEVRVKPDIFRRHLSVLAMSGAGKSNLIKHLLLELNKMDYKPFVVVVDLHREYRDVSFDVKGEVVNLKQVKVPFYEMKAFHFKILFREMGEKRYYLVRNLLKEAKEKNILDLKTFSSFVYSNVKNANTRDALMNELSIVEEMDVVGEGFDPLKFNHKKFLFMDAFDVDGDELRFRFYILLNRLFELRRKGQIPPTIVFVEEAHNFFREGPSALEGERIAREGRKFNISLVLITQRPVHLSQNILSQCNSSIIMRMVNPLDIERIKSSVEGADSEIISSLPYLNRGEGFIVSEFLSMPVFFKSPLVSRKVEKRYEEDIKDYWFQKEKMNLSPDDFL